MKAQKQRYEQLLRKCEEIIAREEAALTDQRARPQATPDPDKRGERAENMEKPGNWRRANWNPQFRYWELIKACWLNQGYQVKEGVGVYDPETGEIWVNPSFDDLVRLIIGVTPAESTESI